MSRGLVMVCDVDLGLADATRTHTVEVARGFAAQGLAVDLVARGPGTPVPGVTYHEVTAALRPRLRRLLAVDRLALALLWRRRREARLCYVRHLWAQVPVLFAARALGYRLVTQVDDLPYGRGYEGSINPTVDYASRGSTMLMGQLVHGVVAVTGEIGALLVEQFHVPRERVMVLPNGVNVDLVRPRDRSEAIAEAGLDPDGEYVVWIGRLAGYVDFDLILDAFAQVVAARSAARLLLVGDGEEAEHIDRGVESRHLGSRVVRTGSLHDRLEVGRLLGAATVALDAQRAGLATRIGVSPVKVAEYFAAARAVVAVDRPSLGDAIRAAGGGIVVPADPSAMAQAIASLLADPGQADELGAAGRRAAEDGYSWASIARRTLTLFDDR